MAKTDKPQTHRKLFENIKAILHEARNAVARNINTAMVMTYFEIGRIIVIDDQMGKKRAGYAEETMKNLSLDLTREFGKGFSERNLRAFRQFYLTYSARIIWQSPIAKSKANSLKTSNAEMPFSLSWTHYLLLMHISNEDERRFCEIEAANQNWSVRELERQFNSSLYERLALSRDKKKVRELGIILCKEAKKAVVEFTLPKDNEQIFARKYQLYLPSKEELKKQLEG